MTFTSLHPATVASIEAQGLSPVNVAQIGYWRQHKCGCEYLASRNHWRLCQYHQGYEDAFDLMANENATGEYRNRRRRIGNETSTP